MLEVGGDHFVGYRLGRRRSVGVAGGLVQRYFQHMNIRTPQWLGYLIQRPEAHCIHHQRDVHAFNYGDLPVWDMLFGTFRNPPAFQGPVGFDKPATDRLGAMFGFVDVNEAVAGPDSLGRSQRN